MSPLLKNAIAATAFLGLANMPAMAGDMSKANSITVDVTELDLTNPAGAQVAYARIKRAARQVCNVPRGAAPVRERLDARACVERAVDQAVADFGSQQLATVLHRDRVRG